MSQWAVWVIKLFTNFSYLLVYLVKDNFQAIAQMVVG